MTQQEYETRLKTLLDQIATLPPEQQAALQPAVAETHARHLQITESANRMHTAIRGMDNNIKKMEDGLSTVRLMLKYLQFSMECTAREMESDRRDDSES